MSPIKELISNNEELSRLLPMIGGITIIEYDGEDIQGSTGLYEYMLDNALLLDAVNRIIICGRQTERLQQNYYLLQSYFPSAKIEKTSKKWQNTEFNSLKVLDLLVFHMAATVLTDYEFDREGEKAKHLRKIIRDTRHAYYACVLSAKYSLFDFDDYDLRVQLRLKDFEFDVTGEREEPTSFCRDKLAYMEMCEETLTPKDLFFQIAEEAEHGCESCNQCDNYGKSKKCPAAQRKIADYYRRGMYVPIKEIISHQWEMKASRQGYYSARIQVADNFANGFGCCKSVESALRIYKEYARKNDTYCTTRIIQLVSESGDEVKLAAIPYIAFSAQNGNEDMILMLSDAFQKGDFCLPTDTVQQEEWIRQGAENGNPRFVKAIAEMYEANSEWAESYRWYKTLSEVCPEMLIEDKLEEVELRMLTHGANDEEIAIKGMDYLYGYHGVVRDTHLAYRCLSYAKEKGIALAEGLLGQMYFHGVGVEKNENKGTQMIISASNAGDLLSRESVATELCPSGHIKWVIEPIEGNPEEELFHELLGNMADAIEEELKKEKISPIAYYLKGEYCQMIYSLPDEEAYRLMKKAAELDYPPAQYSLAVMYKKGEGTFIDTSLYGHWLEISANNGYFVAEGEYGKILYSSWRTSNKTKSFGYLRRAIDKGYEDDEANWCLAQCYMYGYGTSIDKGKAYPLYIQAAEKGNADAQVKLCEDYFKGNEHLKQDYTECARWGEEAIKQGKKTIRFETAYSLAEISKKERAYELYLELAEEGNVAAMNNLGCLESEEKKAFEWFLKAANKGSSVAMKNVARYFRYGIAVEKDETKAMEYYIKSANLGYIDAIKELANMYRNGYSTEKNLDEAIKWYEKAISKGNVDSILDLASLFADELGDVDKAINYYKQAAEKGNVLALLRLGEMNEQKHDVDSAIFWYRKAATLDSEEAKVCLKRLGANWLEDGEIEDGSDDEGQYDNDNDDLPF